MKFRGGMSGFALPTVVISSLVLMIVLVAGLSAVTSTNTSLQEQYYDQLTREAAEAGIAMAQSCLQQNGIAQWSDSSPLRPSTSCSGGVACTNNPTCYVMSSNNIKTTFSVGSAVALQNGSYSIAVAGTTMLLRTSNQAVLRSIPSSQNATITLATLPKVAGGAGWANNGHIGVLQSADRQLYAYGDNSNYQITDSGTPAMVMTPVKMSLPLGVTYVNKVVTSGQGASYVCIIGSDNQAYCRGKPGNGETSPFSGNTWNKISGWPIGYNVYTISINGYGYDNVCVLAGVSQATAGAYCVGTSSWGRLGAGPSAMLPYYYANNAQQFILPNGIYAAKISTMMDQTCVLTTTNDVYCAGSDFDGQLTWVNSGESTPIKFNLPNGRKAADVLVGQYHNLVNVNSVHVLATDGTIWTAGSYADGNAGNGTTSGSTGTSQTPVLFGGFGVGGTGDAIRLASQPKCIDNSGWVAANDNPVVIWDCATDISNQGQRWLYNQVTHVIENIATGKCLDIPNGTMVAGAQLEIYDCNGSSAQRFTFNVSGAITPDAGPGLCIDVIGGDVTNGTRLQLYTCLGNFQQTYTKGVNINGWRSMMSGNNYFCGLRDDTSSGMLCAGLNTYGQLMNWGASVGGSNVGAACTTSSTPQAVQLPAGEKVDWTKMDSEWAYQYDSLVVLTQSGKLYGAGRNIYGKLGNGALGDSANGYRSCSVTKFQMASGVTALGFSARDEFSTYILGSDGSLYATGMNNNGQLGVGSTSNMTVPTRVQTQTNNIVIY